MKLRHAGVGLLTVLLLMCFTPAVKEAPTADAPSGIGTASTYPLASDGASPAPSKPFVYGEQLQGLALSLYQLLQEQTAPGELHVDLPEPFTFETSLQAEEEEIAQAQAEAGKQLSVAFQSSLDALLKDNLYQFWIGVGKSGSTFTYTSSGKQEGDHILWTLPSITIHLRADEDYATDPAAAVAAVREQVNAFAVSGTTRYERLKSIHDGLAARIVYDIEAAHAHEAYGALIDGRSVCEGYAKSFKMLCDRENIPCVLVKGLASTGGEPEGHMWNYVQMEDGKWYAVDVTWDDQTDGVRYEFFLAGAKTPAPAFGSGLFEETHKADGDFSNPAAKIFVYPELGEEAYGSGSGGTTAASSSSSSAVSRETNAPTASGGPTASTAMNESTQTAANSTTGSIETTDSTEAGALPTEPTDGPVPTGSTLWPATRPTDPHTGRPLPYGDFNYDGKVDTTDARLVLQYAVGKLSEVDTMRLSQADVSGDGAVDTTDARLILQFAVGKLQKFPRQ